MLFVSGGGGRGGHPEGSCALQGQLHNNSMNNKEQQQASQLKCPTKAAQNKYKYEMKKNFAQKSRQHAHKTHSTCTEEKKSVRIKIV